MVIYMKVSGKMIIGMDKVRLLIKQVDRIMENGIMGLYMAMVSITMKMAMYMKEILV
tara:strand:+ start:293 stop:463 length:171 start_codon:yes stop_codon:yes gene_type:complete